MPKLTKRVVDMAVAGPAQAFTWDSEVKGFGLRVTPAGVKSYVLSYRDAGGQTRRITIGKHGSPWTCETARIRAIEALRGLTDGIDPRAAKIERRTATTVADLVDIYLAEGPAEKPNKKASTWAFETSSLRRHVVPLLGDRPTKALTAADVSRMQADIAAGKTAADIKTGKQGRAIVKGGKAVAGHATAVLSIMLSFAVRRKLITTNPAIGVERLKPKARERFLSVAEVVALADALATLEAEQAISPTMAAAIRLLTLTACRKSEITGLRWAWVDLGRSCLRLPDSKTGAKVVPLAAAAVELLASLPRTSAFVLPSAKTEGPIVGLQKTWNAVRTRATTLARARAVKAGEPADGAPDFTALRMHDLRHSYASFAVEDGGSLYIVGKVLGHAQASTTQRYAHLRDDPLKAVVDRTGEKIAEAMREGAARGRMSNR
ncbi:MAG: tyrosine-type recombinase/integrase [Janthinobacterium lividum]